MRSPWTHRTSGSCSGERVQPGKRRSGFSRTCAALRAGAATFALLGVGACQASGAADALVPGPARLALSANSPAFAPVGRKTPQPLTVVVGDGAACAAADALGQRVFVLCVDPSSTEARPAFRANLTKLKREFGAHLGAGAVPLLAVGPVAARFAAALALEEPAFFQALLVVGAEPDWDSGQSTRFHAGGGRMLALVGAKPLRTAVRTNLQRAGVVIHEQPRSPTTPSPELYAELLARWAQVDARFR